MLSKIESGVVNFLTNITGNNKTYSNSNNSNDLIEQYNSQYSHLKSNPLPKQNKNLVNETTLNKNNIYEDSGNLGNYLINNTTQKDILEGFVTNPNTTKPNTTKPKTTKSNITKPNTTKPNTTKPSVTETSVTKPSVTKPSVTETSVTKPSAKETSVESGVTSPVIITTKPKINIKNNKKNENTSIVSKIFSGDFVDYVMEVTNDKLNIFYTAYYNQFGNIYSYGSGSNNSNDSKNNFNLDDNLVPAGFLLFILSMLFYFIDLTS